MKTFDSRFNSYFFNRFVGIVKIRQVDLKIIDANVKACEILGAYNIMEKTFDQYLYDIESISRFRSVNLALTNELEVKIVQPGGKVRWVSVSHSAVIPGGLMEILLYDKTDDKKRIEHLEGLNHQLNEFVHQVSHDLRSPVAGLLGLLNLSKNEIDSIETLQYYIGLMQQRTEQLDNMLADLLSMALNEKTTIDLENIEVEEEIKEILTNVQIRENPVDIQVDVKQQHSFWTDVKRLRIILRNLISNSIKYQNPDEKYPLVKIAFIVERDRAILAIEDNGIGIHPKHIDKIFDKFFRATDRSSGSGLGLYIVKSMVDKLGGKIALSSSPLTGSKFKIEIPNKRANNGQKTDPYRLMESAAFNHQRG